MNGEKVCRTPSTGQFVPTHFLSKDQNKVKYYKSYSNTLDRTKDAAKKMYFQRQFRLNSENLKTTWKVVGMLINRKKKDRD